jgi:hypothetical protein
MMKLYPEHQFLFPAGAKRRHVLFEVNITWAHFREIDVPPQNGGVGIGINGFGYKFPFLDTNAFHPKRKFFTSAFPWLIIQLFSMI